ncbi:MAG TPA: C39 family peptidase [Candidatus Xenobia bacterium]|jgi:predicted double-glycine peptidase
MQLPANMIAVPLVAQETNYSCGDASSLALLRFWHWDSYARTPESDLYVPLQTSQKDGTEPQPIERYFNHVPGLSARYRTDATLDDLEAAVGRRQPLIVDLQAWQDNARDWTTDWDDGHYVVLAGYDKDNLFLMDPSTENQYAYIPKAEFMTRWHDTLGPQNQKIQHMIIEVQGQGMPHESHDVPADAARMM